MTRWIDRLLESRAVRPIRRIQLVLALTLYGYAYLSPRPRGRLTLPLDDAQLHVIGTALLFLSVYVAARERARLWQMAAFAGFVSVGLEYGQSFAPLRVFDWRDLLMNGLGIGLATVALAISHRMGWIGRI